ncbi:uncharacterized protein LOC126750028 [Anthonomus grandis grandis]|uniref:uncharacterized protein LOC126750028 n=1 Tax=Anthonomus grandis grandis TaxID=2921223 RepID=UPI002165295E|nr:uncharacterized protein LOC126750028 [Anthonomus grandis grandis]
MVLLQISGFITWIFIPWNVLLLFIMVLAAIGKSVGVRRLYIKILLYVFEFGRKSIEAANKRKHRRILAQDSDSSDEGYEEGAPKIENDSIISRSAVNNNETGLICREKELILVPETLPEPENQHDKEEKINFDIKHWLKTLDYVKSGIEAIIEDQVTSRFEIQELKKLEFLNTNKL